MNRATRASAIVLAGASLAVPTFEAVALSSSNSSSFTADDYVQTFDTPGSLDDMIFEIADGRSWPGDGRTFTGDHAPATGGGACGGPTTTRTLNSGDYDFATPVRLGDGAVKARGLVYWCPNGAEHIMTAYDTGGYAHFDFRPDEVFDDVRKVCWDQNITDMGGGKWTEVAVVPLSTFQAHGGRMDYTHPERNGPGRPGSWGLKIDSGVWKGAFHGTQQSSSNNQQIFRGDNEPLTTEDKGLRTTHCVTDNRNGTVTMSRGLADGRQQSDVLPGAFPAGDSVVIFSDVSYNPTKRDGYDPGENSWHWDNILISSSPFSEPPGGGGGNEGGGPPADFPARMFDSRGNGDTVDNRYEGDGTRRNGSITRIDIAGRGAVPGNTSAVALNVTATKVADNGYMTVYNCDGSPPNASNLNFTRGTTIANSVLAELSNDGDICIFTAGSADLVVDVTGTLPASGFDGIRPSRMFDSRGNGDTVDNRYEGDGTRRNGSITRIDIAGRGAVPGNTSAVALNVTATKVADNGYMTVYNCDGSPPNASNLNFTRGTTIANSVLAELSNDGDICIFTAGSADLVVDVTGTLPASGFDGIRPSRMFDSRGNGDTVDNRYEGDGTRRNGSITRIDIAGRGAVPGNTSAVALNVTATKVADNGYMTVYNCDGSPPNASNLNFTRGTTIANSVLAELSNDGDICIFTAGSADLVVDVTGTLPTFAQSLVQPRGIVADEYYCSID